MYDWLTARAVAAELREKIAGGRVQAVVPLNGLALGFEIYAHQARHYLYVSAETSEARSISSPKNCARVCSRLPDSSKSPANTSTRRW